MVRPTKTPYSTTGEHEGLNERIGPLGLDVADGHAHAWPAGNCLCFDDNGPDPEGEVAG
jgi:hypothetical protein